MNVALLFFLLRSRLIPGDILGANSAILLSSLLNQLPQLFNMMLLNMGLTGNYTKHVLTIYLRMGNIGLARRIDGG